MTGQAHNSPNGAAAKGRNRRRVLRPAGRTLPFSLDSSERFRPEYFLSMSWYLVGLGTTGTAIVRSIVDSLRGGLGRRPRTVNYLLIDSIAPPFDHHRRHFVSTGKDGAGTNPLVGRGMFFQHYGQIRNAVLQQMDGIMRGSDPLLPRALAPREALGFFLIGSGIGGTSGGMLDPTISLVHDAARHLNIEQPQVHVLMISPDMVLKDITRQPIPEQVAMIHATYAQNQSRILGHMQLDGHVCEQRPDGSRFYVKAEDRVFSLHKADRSNGLVDLSTTANLVSTIADTLRFCLFTAAGHFLDQRNRDIMALGAAGRLIH